MSPRLRIPLDSPKQNYTWDRSLCSLNSSADNEAWRPSLRPSSSRWVLKGLKPSAQSQWTQAMAQLSQRLGGMGPQKWACAVTLASQLGQLIQIGVPLYLERRKVKRLAQMETFREVRQPAGYVLENQVMWACIACFPELARRQKRESELVILAMPRAILALPKMVGAAAFAKAWAQRRTKPIGEVLMKASPWGSLTLRLTHKVCCTLCAD